MQTEILPEHFQLIIRFHVIIWYKIPHKNGMPT